MIFNIKIILLVSLIFIGSCKKSEHSCRSNRISEFTSDTSYVPYSGYDTLKFAVTNSQSIPVDTLIFIGLGKKRFVGTGSTYDFSTCSDGIQYQHQLMEFLYLNSKDSSVQLLVNITMKQSTAEINIKYLRENGQKTICSFRDFLFSFYNPWSFGYHETFSVSDTSYHHVIWLSTPSEERTHPDKYLSAYFGRYDGIIKLEETENRIWYKLN